MGPFLFKPPYLLCARAYKTYRQMWWLMHLIPTLKRLKYEGCLAFQAILGYLARPLLKKKTKKSTIYTLMYYLTFTIISVSRYPHYAHFIDEKLRQVLAQVTKHRGDTSLKSAFKRLR